jgi:hypothetical protein
VLCGSAIKLEPGKQYEFGAWIRTENVTGSGGGATLCVQWWQEDGTFIGGDYPSGVKGTSNGWKHVTGRTRKVPENAARMDLTLYLRKGCVGTAYWDDVSLTEYQPPLMTLLLTDCYRDRTDGGRARVSAAINLDSYSLAPESVSCVLDVRNPQGVMVVSVEPVSVSSEAADFVIDADALAPGEYTLACRISAREGALTGSASGRLIRVETFPERKSFIDSHGRLILDGEPFFPLGTYWGGVSPEQLAIYSDSAFNCLMPYARIPRETLDALQAAGIRVIYSVKDLYGGRAGLKDEEEARAKITSIVSDLKDHPAIMAWYINDELPLSMFDALKGHRDLLEELDPGRPTWVVLYQVGQVRSDIPTFDVIGTDPYPIPRSPASKALSYTRETVAASFGYRPVWMVPQIFNWASYKKDPEEKKKHRSPTLEEMRSMAWQCIAGGANGLVFYSWHDLWRMDKTVEQGGRALVREPFEERWKDVRTMAAEIGEHIPILLSVDTPLPLVSADGPTNVAWRLYAYQGDTVLVAVNSADEPAQAAFTFGDDLLQAYASLGSRTLRLNDRTVLLEFAPLEARVIHITPAPNGG